MPNKTKLSLNNLSIDSFVTSENSVKGGKWTNYLVCGTGANSVVLCEYTKQKGCVSNVIACIPETQGGLDCPSPI